jgi:hypothetical protein
VNAPSDIAVVRARLPYTDHRALSQAWYAALKLSRDEGAPMVKRSRPQASPTGARNRSRTQGESVPAQHHASSGVVARQATRPIVPAYAYRSKLEAGLRSNGAASHSNDARKQSIPGGASFTVSLGDARVRIVARSDGNRLQLTAVCNARHSEIVRRALAHASIGLGLCGARVDTAVHCEEEPS